MDYILFFGFIFFSMVGYGGTQRYMDRLAGTKTIFTILTNLWILGITSGLIIVPTTSRMMSYQTHNHNVLGMLLFPWFRRTLWRPLLDDLYKIPVFWFGILLITSSLTMTRNIFSYLSYLLNYSTYTAILHIKHANHFYLQWFIFNLAMIYTVIVPICIALITIKTLRSKLKHKSTHSF